MFHEPIPTAADLLSRDFLALNPSVRLTDAVEHLHRDRAHTAFVVDHQQHLVGLLCEKDCLRAVAARAYDEAVSETVQDVMQPAPPAVERSSDVYALAQTFLATSAAMLPVVHEGKLVGGVSQAAALRALLRVLRDRARLRSDGEAVRVDLEQRPASIERMQKVFADWRPDQIASLLKQNR